MKKPKTYGVKYQSMKGAILGPGSGIKTIEQAKAVIKDLRRK
jgi:hypothetical protein